MDVKVFDSEASDENEHLVFLGGIIRRTKQLNKTFILMFPGRKLIDELVLNFPPKAALPRLLVSSEVRALCAAPSAA